MKIFSTLLFGLVCCAVSAQAQSPVFYPSNYPKFLGKSTSDTLINAFTGGIKHPIFGNVDINMDGREDLVILDREIQSNGAVLPFLSVRKGNSYYYAYAPQYTHLFPPIKGWGIFADYNYDGKNDLFLYSEPFGVTGSVTAFKNVSSGDSVRFQMQRKQVGKYSKSSSGFDKISVNLDEIPAFSDMDNDGDLDMLVFHFLFSTTIDYYQNVSKDSAWSHDSLKFALVDQCWGRFQETGVPGVLETNYRCNQDLAYHPYRMHSGSAISAIDIDGDGDKDLLIGDATYPYLLLAENHRLPVVGTGKSMDTIGSYKPTFPDKDPVRIRNNPMASLVDVNADGKVDILASPMEISTARKDIVWHYENTGTTSKPAFSFRDSTFLEKTMLDQGDNSAPCFLDYDDGKMDLLLAVSSEENDTHTEQIYHYRNIGTSTRPVFSLVDKDFLNLSESLFVFIAPAIGDVNNDGKPDLLLGNSVGKIYYFLNQSTTGGFQFSSPGTFLEEDDNGSSVIIDIGDNSIPTVGDLNGDGKADILLGNKSGNIAHYENIGTGSTPLFKKVTANFGAINTQKEAAPCLGFVDADDTLDLVVGSGSQPIRFYRNVNASGAGFTAATNLFYNFAKTNKGEVSLYRSIPALAHLDQDSSIDLVLGNARGGLIVYTSTDNKYTLPSAGLVDSKKPEPLKINIYPNPTKGKVTVSLEDIAYAQPATVTLTDMLGRQVRRISFTAPKGDVEKEINVTGFAPGMYMVRVTLPQEGRFSARQLIISR